MEAEVVLNSVRAEEDDPLGRHHQDETVQGLQTEANTQFVLSPTRRVISITTQIFSSQELKSGLQFSFSL